MKLFKYYPIKRDISIDMRKLFYTIRNLAVLITLCVALPLSGCKKYVLVSPSTTTVLGTAVYASDATAIAVLNGLYSQMIRLGPSNEGSICSLSFFTELSGDEFTLLNTVTNSTQLAYYQNNLGVNGTGAFWANFYNYIYTCNAAIEGLNAATGLTPAVQQQLLGEAKFLRAFYYFYLVNLYGDVPLALTSDYTKNVVLARTPKDQVYQQIVSDLTDAEGLLYDGYLQANLILPYTATTAERVRPNKYAAAALLARVYLYTNKYAEAITQASIVINNSTYYALTPLNNVYLKNSKEAIWQLQPINAGVNTPDAQFFIYPTTAGPTTSNPVFLSNALLGAFEPGDQRKINGNWVNSVTIGTTTYTYPFKYKIYLNNTSVTTASALTEYEMVLRLGEQYLIRSEAETQQNQLTQAIADLNAIRSRAGLIGTTATTQQQLLAAILHERQVELFSESGHRWFDLKRTGNVNAVMGSGGATALKGGSWTPTQALYPIQDILRDPQLTQNPGY